MFAMFVQTLVSSDNQQQHNNNMQQPRQMTTARSHDGQHSEQWTHNEPWRMMTTRSQVKKWRVVGLDDASCIV